MAKFTNFDVPFPSTANLLEERDLGNEDDSNEYTSGKQEHYNQIIGQSQIIYTEIEPLPNYSGSSTTGTVSRASKNYSQNYSSHIAGSKFNSSSFQSDCLNNGQSFDERLEDKALSETEERASLCSTPSDTKIENELGPKKCQNLNPTKGNEDTVTITKSPRPSNFHKTTTINGDRKKDVGVQTNITEQNIDAEHLLKELREWDAKAVNQSRKYTPRKSGASKQQLKINHKQDLQKNVVKIKVGTNKL